MAGQMFLRVEEVAEELGVSRPYAYKLIRKLKGILAGGDILALTAEVDVTNIADFLKKTYGKYVLNTYKANFSWVDQIQAVKDTRLIERLDSELSSTVIAPCQPSVIVDLFSDKQKSGRYVSLYEKIFNFMLCNK